VSFVAKNPDIAVGAPDYPTSQEDYDNESDGDSEGRFLMTYSSEKHKRKYPDLTEAVKSLKALFEAEDILKHVFGEHAQVVATPEKIVCEEYEHD
jgi:hypothetical protein